MKMTCEFCGGTWDAAGDIHGTHACLIFIRKRIEALEARLMRRCPAHGNYEPCIVCETNQELTTPDKLISSSAPVRLNEYGTHPDNPCRLMHPHAATGFCDGTAWPAPPAPAIRGPYSGAILRLLAEVLRTMPEGSEPAYTTTQADAMRAMVARARYELDDLTRTPAPATDGDRMEEFCRLADALIGAAAHHGPQGPVVAAGLHALGAWACAAVRREDRLREQRDAYPEHFIRDVRGVVTPCRRCGGIGVRCYGSTATWRGGVGGQTITSDVCDWCWGSGDDSRRWPSHRALSPSPPGAPGDKKATKEEP